MWHYGMLDSCHMEFNIHSQWEVCVWDRWENLEWVVISELPWPQPYTYNTPESVICAIHHTEVVPAGPELKVRRWSIVREVRAVCALHNVDQTLKLFSLGLRLMMTLKVSYGSSAPLWMLLVMSCWYWFGSSQTRNVLASPRSLGFGSGPWPERSAEQRFKNISVKHRKIYPYICHLF